MKLFKISNKIDLVPHYVYSHQYINNTTCRHVCYKKEIERQWINSRVGYFTFHTKNCLHYKVKVIIFFTSLVKIYWMNVSIRFFFFSYKNKTSPGSREGEASSIFGGVLYINRDSLTVDHSGNVFGCFIRSAG